MSETSKHSINIGGRNKKARVFGLTSPYTFYPMSLKLVLSVAITCMVSLSSDTTSYPIKKTDNSSKYPFFSITQIRKLSD